MRNERGIHFLKIGIFLIQKDQAQMRMRQKKCSRNSREKEIFYYYFAAYMLVCNEEILFECSYKCKYRNRCYESFGQPQRYTFLYFFIKTIFECRKKTFCSSFFETLGRRERKRRYTKREKKRIIVARKKGKNRRNNNFFAKKIPKRPTIAWCVTWKFDILKFLFYFCLFEWT